MLDRLLIFDRDWECIYDINLYKNSDIDIAPHLSQLKLDESSENIKRNLLSCFESPAVFQSRDEDPRLLIGTIYSLGKVLMRMAEDGATNDLGCTEYEIQADNDDYRLIYYETPTKLKFVALVRQFAGQDYHNFLGKFYREIFVPYACRNPLVLRSSSKSYIMPSLLSSLKQEIFKFSKIQTHSK